MHPILFQYNSIIITSFGLFLTLAFVVFMAILVKLINKKGLDMDFFSNHILSLFIGTILGAKALYWIFNYDILWTYISSSLEHQDYASIFKYLFNIEQFYVMGGILVFSALFWFYTKKNKQLLLPWLDALLPALSLGLVFGFIGSFFGGYFVGKPSPSFPGILFNGNPDFSFAAANYIVPIHPIQLYSALLCLIIFFILMEVLKKIKIDGVTGTLGIFLLSLQDLLVEFFRGNDNIPLLFGGTINQYISACGILFALYVFTKKIPKITTQIEQS